MTATNVAAGKSTSGLLSGYWDTSTQSGGAATGAPKISNGQASNKNDLALVPLSKSSSAVNPQFQEEQTVPTYQGNGIIAAATPINAMKDPEQDGGVKVYTVQQGDVISEIAAKNNISINTILWANDIADVDSIKPGDTIFILPVSGIQYVVKSGDNIDAIAAKFKSDRDKIIAFNDLPADGSLDVGKTITIPDGQGEAPAAAAPAPTQPVAPAPATGGIQNRQYATSTGGTPQISGFKTLSSGGGNTFPYGYCTWYVASKRNIPWDGNAGTWLYHAKAAGYATGRSPQVGAVMVTTENRYYGHVALVVGVSGGSFTVSEMNYVGFGKVDRRVLPTSDPAIKGFIY